MKIISEWKCPNCNKEIQHIQTRCSYIRKKKSKRGEVYTLIKGVYKIIIKASGERVSKDKR